MSGTTTHAHGSTAPESDAVVIDLKANTLRRVIPGTAISAVIGLIGLYSAATGQLVGEPQEVITTIAVVISSTFLLIGLLPVLTWRKLTRPRSLRFDATGIRLADDLHGWAVTWDELAGVAISRTKQRRVKPADFIARRVLVRLDLFPADRASFRAAHPEMEPLWELHRVKGGYRLPFGHAPQLVPVIDKALQRFAPALYRGVVDEGFSVGLF